VETRPGHAPGAKPIYVTRQKESERDLRTKSDGGTGLCDPINVNTGHHIRT